MNTFDALQDTRRNLLLEKDGLRAMTSAATKRTTAVDKEIKALDAQLSGAEKPGLRASDHAVLQYVARVYRLDLASIRAELAPQDPATLAAIATLGDGVYGVGSSHRVVIKEGTIVTVLPLV